MAALARGWGTLLPEQVSKLSADIFGNHYNPFGNKSGIKIMRKPLIGEQVANYYTDVRMYTYTRPNKTNNAPWMYIDPKHGVRLNLRERHRVRGKVKTKKGEGKRSKRK